jgi:hypothetical protein
MSDVIRRNVSRMRLTLCSLFAYELGARFNYDHFLFMRACSDSNCSRRIRKTDSVFADFVRACVCVCGGVRERERERERERYYVRVCVCVLYIAVCVDLLDR